LVEEERPILVVDETVQIFEDDDTRRPLTGFPEDLGHRTFFPHPT